MSNENTIPAVEKTIRLLDHLAASAGGASQAELAQILHISGATCYRIIQSLLKYGWLKKTGNRFELAQGLLPLARKVYQAQEWQEQIKPHILALAEATKLSVKVSVRQGVNEYVTVFRAESPRPVAVSGRLGATFPVVEGSVGGALLCQSNEAEIRRLIAAAPDDLLEKQQPELVFARIAECREKGFCNSNGRNRWGIEVLSAPLLSGDQVRAAVSLLGLSPDFVPLTELEQELLKTRRICEGLL